MIGRAGAATASPEDRPASWRPRLLKRFAAPAAPPPVQARRVGIPFLDCGPEVVVALSTGSTAFQDLALAFFLGRAAPDGAPATGAVSAADRATLRDHFGVLVENFERDHEGLVRSYFGTNCRAAAALTAKDEIEVVLVGDMPPSELIQIIRRAQALGYAAWHRLEPYDRRLCQRMIFSVIIEVLRRLDLARQESRNQPSEGSEPEISPTDIAYLRQNLDDAEDFMLRCATQRAQTQYVRGMLRRGSLLVAPVIIAAVVVGVVDNRFDGLLGQALLVAIAGAAGAMVSVMWRMTSGTFSINLPSLGYTSGDVQLMLMGAVRPMIGAIFALAVLVFAKSPLLPLEAASKDDTFLLVALGFLAGFSERFAQDMFVRSGQGLAGPGGDSPSSGMSAGLAPPPGGARDGGRDGQRGGPA
jgi:hypothetical protein